MNNKLILAALCTALAVVVATPAFAGKKKKKQQEPEPTAEPDPHQEMMEQWMKLSTPGDPHKALEPMIGDWTATSRMWMAGPEGEPTVGAGTCTNSWALGGRYMLQEYRSEGGPMGPMEGVGWTGYDNVRNLYVGTWVDNMSTQIMVMKGSMVPGSDTIVMYAEMDEPSLGVYGRMVRMETVIESPDKHIFTMYDTHAGTDYKAFEIEYVRKGSEGGGDPAPASE